MSYHARHARHALTPGEEVELQRIDVPAADHLGAHLTARSAEIDLVHIHDAQKPIFTKRSLPEPRRASVTPTPTTVAAARRR